MVKYQILRICFVLAGLTDSLYLTYKHFENQNVVCSVLEGCDVVLNSQYAVFFGVPVALLGLLFYFIVLVFCVFIFFKRQILEKAVFILTLAGFLTSLYFLYLQIFVIKELCLYCLISLMTATNIFIFSWLVQNKRDLVNED